MREGQYLPTKWAESKYIAPYELEAQGSSAMPLEAIFDIERYSEEEICQLKPSFCEYNAERGFPNAVAGAPLVDIDTTSTKSCPKNETLYSIFIENNPTQKITSLGMYVGLVIGICLGFILNSVVFRKHHASA